MIRRWGAVGAIVWCAACGGDFPIIGRTTDSGIGAPSDVVQVRLFDAAGTDRTVHLGLVDDEMLQIEARLFAADGRRLTEITGGVNFALRFTPETLATSAEVLGEPLRRIITPTASSGTVGSQTADLHFPGDNSSKTFGPFHVQIEPSVYNGVAQMRLFDDRGVDMTQHIPLVSGDTTRLEVRLYDTAGQRLTDIPGGVETGFRIVPDSVAVAILAQAPFHWKMFPRAPTLTDGSLFVSVRFLADNVTKTYGPTQILVH